MAHLARSSSYRIDPFDLRLFMAVVGQGSITAGARSVSLSLAAASARIAQLEHGMGVRLLARAKKGVTPTDAGLALMRGAGRLLREIDVLHDELAPYARGVRGTVRVVGNTAAMSVHLPPLIGPFLAAHPRVDLDLRELGSVEAVRALRLARADIALVADHADTAGLVVTPFRPDVLVVLAGPGQRLPRRRTLAFADVAERPLVGLVAESGLTRFLQQQALLGGRTLQHRVMVKTFDAVASLVAQGVGLAVVPEGAARRWPMPGVTQHPLRDAWAARQLLVCQRGDVPPAPSVAGLLAVLSPG